MFFPLIWWEEAGSMGVRNPAFCAVPLKREQNARSGDKLSFSEATVFLQILEERLPPSGRKSNKQSSQPWLQPVYKRVSWVSKEGFYFGLLSFLSWCLHNIDIPKKKKVPIKALIICIIEQKTHFAKLSRFFKGRKINRVDKVYQIFLNLICRLLNSYRAWREVHRFSSRFPL